MYPYRKKGTPLNEVLSFTYPKLHTKKNWYVDFLAYDPAEGKMKRKKYMLDSIPKVTERRKRASELIESLMKQLRSGWSPWVNVESSRGYTLLSDALNKYLGYIEKQPRYKTVKTYTSNVNVLREYISTLLLPPRYVYQFDTTFVSEFLDWLYLDREVSARTRNNYRGWCSSLAAFFMEREYIGYNPVEKIRKISEEDKKRKALTPQMLAAMKNYLYKHDKKFLLACMIEYYSFIRPTELCSVRLCDISLSEQTILIHAEVSKNKRDGKVAINSDIVSLLLELEVFSHHDDCFLFGDKLVTSEKQGSSEMFRRKWNKMRAELKWSDDYQFYSLKDSGIRDLANAEGIVIARDQARHTDISTTNKYLKGSDLPVHSEVKRFKGYL